MGINVEKKVSVTISGTFAATDLVQKITDMCDGDTNGWEGHLSGFAGGDQREPAYATLNLTRRPPRRPTTQRD